MKAEISKDGTLLVKAENDLESFALNKWYEENIDGCTLKFKSDSPRCFYIDSDYPRITLFHRIWFKIQLFLYK